MAEGNGHSGKSFGSRGGRGGQGGYRGRGGNGGYRGNGGGSRGGFRRDGERQGGFRKGGDRDGSKPRFHRDGDFDRDRRPREDGEQGQGGYRKGGDRPFRKGGQGGFRRDGEHRGGFRGNGGSRGGFRRDDHRDDRRNWRDRSDGDQRPQNAGEGTGEGGERRDFHRGNGGFNRGGQGGFRRGNGGYRKGGNPRYGRGDDDRRGGFRHDGENAGERRDGFRKDRDFRRDGEDRGERRDFHREERGDRKDFRRDGKPRFDRDDRSRGRYDEHGEFHENRRGGAHWDKARRNSDGTMSFPSQNPYTDPRPGEPKMPKGMEWSMLSKDEKERLRGLSKEHAENIGLHMLAAYSLEESDPALALQHAKWVARQASRIDMARETLAFIAYRQGDYKLAAREFRTAYRMNGFLDYLPFIADCERGMGNPKKAVEIATGDEAKQLVGESKVEMFLVYAGALGDLGNWDKAAQIAGTVARSKGLPGEYRMRAVQAEQYFLEQAGKQDEAARLDTLLDRLEEQYADDDSDENEDVVIDYDLKDFSDDQLDMLGISEDEAQYAPEVEGEDENGRGDADAEETDAESESSDAEDAGADSAEDQADREADEARTAVEVAKDLEDGNDAETASDDDEERVPAELTEDGAANDADPAAPDADDAADADADAETADGDAESDAAPEGE
ncbi:helicase [Bifidobacterium sp. DSM 109958]|uniref:Helicase n=1 Tax=Bifidobacterium moraviense TaxID=2675323 RepID=A0A7Y0HXX4_9BIFI|nr:helicase [Bifidobacterium sp. DSM 109958]NMM99871.1 helicase [Bifidobacterium sp. DSM 109958]